MTDTDQQKPSENGLALSTISDASKCSGPRPAAAKTFREAVLPGAPTGERQGLDPEILLDRRGRSAAPLAVR